MYVCLHTVYACTYVRMYCMCNGMSVQYTIKIPSISLGATGLNGNNLGVAQVNCSTVSMVAGARGVAGDEVVDGCTGLHSPSSLVAGSGSGQDLVEGVSSNSSTENFIWDNVYVR